MGQVVYTLPEGEYVCGVTSLGDEVFVLKSKEREEMEVYDVVTYRLVRCFDVPNARQFSDMTSCGHYHCVYIADPTVMCIHRVDVQGGATTQLAVNDKLSRLSVTKEHNVLATCPVVRKIKEFNTHGKLLRQLTLPDDVINPCHAMQLTTGQFVVCHGGPHDRVNRVCLMSEDGHNILHAHGGQRGSDLGQYDGPYHLAIDDNEFVFVADFDNRRVTLLSPTLNYVRQVVSHYQLKWDPRRLHLDVQRRRLYVAEGEFLDSEHSKGRVVVFNV